MSARAPYRGSITREQWLINETRTVARLRTDDRLDDDQILERNLRENLFQYPTERELRSITKACCRRLDALSEDPELREHLTALLAHGNGERAAQVNLYALMRDNRIVWDFMANVLAVKLHAYDHFLEKHEIAQYVEGLRAQVETASRWSDATCNKIRQVLTTCLVAVGYLDSNRSSELKPILLDLDLEDAMRANGDTEALAAFGCLE